jgi:hypothetical protein
VTGVAALPRDVVLLHIGPHKTGTTTLQGAFVNAREKVAAHGVHYAGRRRQPYLAILSVTGEPGRPGDPPRSEKDWRKLVKEVTTASAAGKRVVISSERCADADPDAIRRMVQGLGGPRVHILVTLRPLAKILSSHWQQAVQNGHDTPYDLWLNRTLKVPRPKSPSARFWWRHAHDELIERWAAVVGPDNVTVLVLDENDREMYLRVVESMLELPRGILVPEAALSNRSLTAGEVEVIRVLNGEYKRLEWPGWAYARFVRMGIIESMQERKPTPAEARIVTPQWALNEAGGIGAAAAQKIATLGVNVVGDLSSLGAVSHEPLGAVEPSSGDPVVPADVAGRALAVTIAKALADEPAFDPELPRRVTIGDVTLRTDRARRVVRLARMHARARVRRLMSARRR